MKGIVIWAHSVCRSVMALYREMGRSAGCPVKIVLWKAPPVDGGSRVKIGFRSDEFADLDFETVEENREKGRAIVNSHQGWLHLFCVVQASPCFREMLLLAKNNGNRVGVMCEAPCNMASGWRRPLKALYMKTMLKYKMRSIIKEAEFFVDYSGDDNGIAKGIGWSQNKLIPFGYFPPPIEGSSIVKRQTNDPFVVLSTGILSKYRGADVLVEALRILKERGIVFQAIITQDGELKGDLVAKTVKYNLPIEFPGRVDMCDLIKLYETCSVYVGSGRSEPWGMRLNDALNCGAPLVVSRGMGGVKLVDDYGCGLSFEAGNACSLADALSRLAEDNKLYCKCSESAVVAAEKIHPQVKGRELMEIIKGRVE